MDDNGETSLPQNELAFDEQVLIALDRAVDAPPQARIEAFGRPSTPSREGWWENLAPENRRNFLNDMDASQLASFITLLNESYWIEIWASLTPDRRNGLYFSLSQEARNTLWADLSPRDRVCINLNATLEADLTIRWAQMSANDQVDLLWESGENLAAQDFSEWVRTNLWNHMLPDAKINFLISLSTHSPNGPWNAMSQEDRQTLFGHMTSQQKVQMALALAPGSLNAWWQGLSENARETLLNAIDDDYVWSLQRALDDSHLDSLRNNLSAARFFILWNNLDVQNRARHFGAWPVQSRQEWWNESTQRERLFLTLTLPQDDNESPRLAPEQIQAELASENRENPLPWDHLASTVSPLQWAGIWTHLSPDQRNTLWSTVPDWRQRVDLFIALPVDQQDAWWETRPQIGRILLGLSVPEGHPRYWWTSVSPDERFGTMSGLDAEQLMATFSRTPISRRIDFWLDLTVEQRSNLWAIVLLDRRYELFQSMSPDLRTDLWNELSSLNRLGLSLGMQLPDEDSPLLSRDDCIQEWIGLTAFDQAHLLRMVGADLTSNDLPENFRTMLWDRMSPHAQAQLLAALWRELRHARWGALSPEERIRLLPLVEQPTRLWMFTQGAFAPWWNGLSRQDRQSILDGADAQNIGWFFQSMPLAQWDSIWACVPGPSPVGVEIPGASRADVWRHTQIDRIALFQALSDEAQAELWATLENRDRVFLSYAGQGRPPLTAAQRQTQLKQMTQEDLVALLHQLPLAQWGELWTELSEDNRNVLWNGIGRTEARAQLFENLSAEFQTMLWPAMPVADRLFLQRSTTVALANVPLHDDDQWIQGWLQLDPPIRVELWRSIPQQNQSNFFARLNLQQQSEIFRQLPINERCALSNLIDANALRTLCDTLSLAESVRSLLLHPRVTKGLTIPVDVLSQKLQAIEDEAQANRAQAQQALDDVPDDEAHAEERGRLASDLETANLACSQIKDLSFVFQRSDASFAGGIDPVKKRVLPLHDPERSQKQIAKSLEWFINSIDVKTAICNQGNQGVDGCEDNIEQVLSAFHFIAANHEARNYKQSYPLLKAIRESHGREIIDRLGTLVISALESKAESVEFQLAVETVIGEALGLSHSSGGMRFSGIAGTEETFSRWKRIGESLWANFGMGDKDTLRAEIAPLAAAAEQRGVPFNIEHYTTLFEYIVQDEVWAEIWKGHLKSAYENLLQVDSNPHLRTMLDTAASKRDALLEASDVIKATTVRRDSVPDIEETRLSIEAPGFNEPATAENIDALLHESMTVDDPDHIVQTLLETTTRQCLETYKRVEDAIGSHGGEQWELMALGNPAEDQEIQGYDISPTVQLQLEMLRERKPDIQEIVIGDEYEDSYKARIWIKAQLLDFNVSGINNDSPILKGTHHKRLADGLTILLNELPAEDAPENTPEIDLRRTRLQARIEEQTALYVQKRPNELRDEIRDLQQEMDKALADLQQGVTPVTGESEIFIALAQSLIPPLQEKLTNSLQETSAMLEQLQRPDAPGLVAIETQLFRCKELGLAKKTAKLRSVETIASLRRREAICVNLTTRQEWASSKQKELGKARTPANNAADAEARTTLEKEIEAYGIAVQNDLKKAKNANDTSLHFIEMKWTVEQQKLQRKLDALSPPMTETTAEAGGIEETTYEATISATEQELALWRQVIQWVVQAIQQFVRWVSQVFPLRQSPADPFASTTHLISEEPDLERAETQSQSSSRRPESPPLYATQMLAELSESDIDTSPDFTVEHAGFDQPILGRMVKETANAFYFQAADRQRKPALLKVLREQISDEVTLEINARAPANLRSKPQEGVFPPESINMPSTSGYRAPSR